MAGQAIERKRIDDELRIAASVYQTIEESVLIVNAENRIVAANLGLGRAPTLGSDPSHGGGIFQIRRIGYSDAEFMFFGWNKDIRHNTNQLVEVRKGDDSDIRIAVVRKMIAIIREHSSGDFLWESQRLGRQITLSARPADNAGLEEVLMKEFFDATRPHQ